MDKIPHEQYAEIHRLMPIVCVDIVIHHAQKFLLVKRNCEPAKGLWWFPGGRLLKSESFSKASKRIVKSETNLSIANSQLLGFDETIFNMDPFGHGEKTHTINFVYCAQIEETELSKLSINNYHSGYGWVSLDQVYNDRKIHNYIRKFAILTEISNRFGL